MYERDYFVLLTVVSGYLISQHSYVFESEIIMKSILATKQWKGFQPE